MDDVLTFHSIEREIYWPVRGVVAHLRRSFSRIFAGVAAAGSRFFCLFFFSGLVLRRGVNVELLKKLQVNKLEDRRTSTTKRGNVVAG